MWRNWSLVYYWWNCKMVKQLWKTVSWLLKKLKQKVIV